jgi:hypothetical protein
MLAATVAPLFCDASLQGRYSQGTPQSAIVYVIRRSSGSVFACQPSGQSAIMIHSLKKIPQELRRFVVLGVVAGMLTTAVVYSRDEHVPSGGIGNGSKQAFQQPKDRQQAEGWFIPTPRSENGPSDPCQLVGERDRQHGVMQSVLGGIDPDRSSQHPCQVEAGCGGGAAEPAIGLAPLHLRSVFVSERGFALV